MMAGKMSVDGLEDLLKNLEDAQKLMDDFCEDCAKELAARLLALTVKRTPVGHAPKLTMPKGENTVKVKVKGANGKLQNRAFLTAEAARIQQIKLHWAGYTGGTLKRSWTAGEIVRTGKGYTVTVSNPTLYASYVEYGHRQKPGRYVPALGKRLKKGWVPGKYMLTMSEKEIRRIAPAVLERKINKFLKEVIE